MHDNSSEMQVNSDEIALYNKGERRYKIGDIIQVQLTEVKEVETRSIIGNIA